MNHIEQLIEDLCPNGVKFVELRDIGVRNKGTSITAARMKILALSPGPIRIFAGGQTIADVAEDAVPKGHVIRLPSIIVKSRGHIGFTFYEKPFTHKSELWSYTIDHPEADQKFVYYFLLTQVRKLQRLARATSVKLPQLSVRDTDTFKVPLPPLEIQREIVRILDKFTALEAELEAELEARQKQYAHYRAELLSSNFESYRDLSLGEVFEMRAGTHIRAADIAETATSETPYRCFGGNGIRGYVSKFSHDEPVIFIGRQGALCGNVHRASGKVYATEHAVVVTPKMEIDMAWAFHLLSQMDLNQYKTKSAQPGLAVTKLKTLRVSLPPLEEQHQIGYILDNFDALVNDLSSGLPAEILARRRQYGYYRDSLLSFKKAE